MPKPTKYPEGFEDYLFSQVWVDTETGNIYWKSQSKRNARRLDKPVGGLQSKRYLAFRMNFKGQSFLLLNHRVVFYCVSGYWPYGVDHIDGNGLNNKPDNLRACNQKENVGNSAPKEGREYKGIYLRKDRGTWQAQGKSVKLGNYTCKKEAALAYNYWALDYFGEFARLNKVFEDHLDALTEA